MTMPSELELRLRRQGYHILGGHGAFKACQWQRKSLLEGRSCYKERFYGIASHRCLQMTPVVDKCTQQCRFCWRVTPSDIGVEWDQLTTNRGSILEPDDLIDAVFEANLRSLGGYNPAVAPSVKPEKWREAREPKHIAVSLAGEPTLYPYLSDLIDAIRQRGMTSFVVTNGTMPEVIADMTPPTQLYLTLAAPDEETYRNLCRPIVKGAWERVKESQRMLGSLNCRTVNRLTMVASWNMGDVESYSKLIRMGEPNFVEAKGYMFLGFSRSRMSRANSPSHDIIREFSERLSDSCGYYLIDEQVESRVVLLSRSKEIKKLEHT
ncbi:MAG: 4-demethylwyosine synthase TYW1 [Candidatus Thorarchaeota archaeon]|nr:4-demethylwyosine synthase TYW1 [Candidatus Thorarchaeota archaeon]